jgi:transposase
MKDYTGKTVFLGIDVHKRTYALTAISDGQVVKKDTIKACPEVLIAYCKKFFPKAEIMSAYEAGFCGFHLHRRLEAEGFKSLVVDAAGIEIASGDRVKTDKRDSLKIATHLSQGRLKGIRVPSVEREDQRAVTRLRETFVRDRTRTACRLKCLLYQHGLIKAEDKRAISPKRIKELQGLQLNPGLKYVLDHYTSQWMHLNEQIKKIDEEIASQAKNDEAIEAIYMSIPGVGPTSARVLANELEDTLQFANERQLFSYVGLTPSEYSSGEHKRQGHITRQGKPVLRKILVQVAWKAVRLDRSLGEMFEKLATRVGIKKGIIGIARRLVGRMRACFRLGELYRFAKI